ncbi:MAG: PAS domain S-box protein [Candidatus Thorarchaeota archaeon]
MEGLGRTNTDSELFIQSLFDSIPLPSYLWQKKDSDFILINYNTAAKKVIYEKMEDFLYQRASNVIKERKDIIASLNECFNNKKSLSLTTKYIMKTTSQEVYISIINYYIPPDLVVMYIKDLTKEKLAEERLLQSNQKYKKLFEDSPIPIVLIDLQGKILDFNQMTEKLFGYPKQELLNKNYLELTVYPSNLLNFLKKIFLNLIEGKLVEPAEFQLYKKDGSTIWIHTELSLVQIDGNYLIQAFLIDITERKNFELKFKRMVQIERMLSTTSSRLLGTDNIDNAINESLLDIGELINAERAYILLLNEADSLEFYTQEWCLKGKSPQKINPITIYPNHYPWAIEQYRRKGYIFVENKLNLPDSANNVKKILNELKIDSILLFPIIIKGKLYGFTGFDNFSKFEEWHNEQIELFRTSSEVIGNALERKWSEETLKRSHQLLAGIISSMTEAICLIDYNFNIIWTNNVTIQLFGNQLNNTKCYKSFFQREKPCEGCIGIRTFSDGSIHEKEVELNTKEGEGMICWYTSNSGGLNIKGQTEFAVLIFRDITKSKAIEKSLIKSEQILLQLTENLKEKIEERTKELKESEENYKRILNDLDVGFYKGVFRGELLMHNSKLNQILGLDPSISLIGVKSTNFFTDSQTKEKYYELLLTSDYVKDFRVEVKRPDGKIIHVKLNSHLIRNKENMPKEVEGTVIQIDY